ncbi:MAG: hypothetical protein K8R88_09150 [Armatimonadetes bacterium]|nr:hypothetical protein [Armatimonadota bacterium]
MDPFDGERPELSGSLITMEFGPGGRITELWASDPSLPDEGEDFQFCLPPLTFGEESSEDLLPGTILLGARTNPDDPWIVSRNSTAQHTSDGDDDLDDFMPRDQVPFTYDFPLLPEIEATGKFYEIAGQIPQIVWDLTIKNRGKKSIEIGELGFPLALNNFYDGFGWSDDQLKRLWNSRLYIHKFVGGAASWVFAQRMTSEPPGLLMFPGADTGWEFYANIPASLNTPHQWEGIPVVYIYSRATVEREGWKTWSNDHTSLILEPGDSRTFQMRFVPSERDKEDTLSQTLVACGRPAVRLLPSAVAPADVGIAVEVQGTAVKKFMCSKDALIEVDSDEEGGFCFVRPKTPGPVRVSFEDTHGRLSHVHLMFTEPIETLIKKRAQWIVENQVHPDPSSALYKGILLANYALAERVSDAEEYQGASGIECSLADALFLAEKNSIYPVKEEIVALDDYISEFLRDDVQNPSDFSVGVVLTEGTTACYVGRPLTYPSVFNLYHAMYKIAKTYGTTKEEAGTYLKWSARTAIAMFEFGWRHYVRTVGVPGYARIYEMLEDLQSEGIYEELNILRPQVAEKSEEILKQEFPYAGESVLDTSGFEEVFQSALLDRNDEHLERTLRCAFAARSLAPSWWWYGSDKRNWDGADSTPLKALVDRGEACLAHTTIPNSAMFFTQLDRDYAAIPEAYMRLAFGGMMGPWALVRSDGACSMCYSPDLSSKHQGYSTYTGASGLGYFHYLRTVGAYVLPNQVLGTYTFGCHFEQDAEKYVVTPWDGVGRRVIFRQISAEFELEFGQIRRVELDLRKRWALVHIENPSDRDVKTKLRVKGLWGEEVDAFDKTFRALNGVVTIPFTLKGHEQIQVMIEVVRKT